MAVAVGSSINEQVRRHGISHVVVHLPAPIKKAWCVEPARAQEEGSFVSAKVSFCMLTSNFHLMPSP